MLKLTLISVGILLSALRVSALEIPLKGGSGGGVSVGVADMEIIFQEYPETKKAKNEYYTELSKKRADLSARENELSTLRQQLAVLRSTVGDLNQASSAASSSTDTASTGVSTQSVTAVTESMLERERSLTDKESALEQARVDAATAIKNLEEQRSLQIFGKLYSALVQLAEEEGVSLVVDRSSVLYGHETIDLTEKLRRRVRGLPDDAESQ